MTVYVRVGLLYRSAMRGPCFGGRRCNNDNQGCEGQTRSIIAVLGMSLAGWHNWTHRTVTVLRQGRDTGPLFCIRPPHLRITMSRLFDIRQN